MRIELFRALHDSLVLRMRLAHLDLNHDGLLHLGRDHIADLLIAPACGRLCLFCCSRHLPAPFLALVFATALALLFAVALAVAGAASFAAPRIPSSRSRDTVLICAISLRS